MQVKLLPDSGYLVNGTMSVPCDPANSDYRRVQEWIAEGNTPAPVRTPEEEANYQRQRAIAQIERDFAEEVAALEKGYHEKEILSWDRQVKQAEAYTSDPIASTPLLNAIATARGITKANLAARILDKAAQYDVLYGEILGRKQRRLDELEGA